MTNEAIPVVTEAPAEPATPVEAPIPAYTPSYEVEVMDQKREIPERFRTLIKDADSEKEVKEIFSKAYGLEWHKPKYEENKKAYEKLTDDHKNLVDGVGLVRKSYEKGDFDTFFDILQIPQEKVLQWVAGKVKYEELPPDQKRIIDERRAAEVRARDAETSYDTLQGEFQKQLVSLKEQTLGLAMGQPTVRQFAADFEKRLGQGSFRQEVIRRGQLAWQTRKIDLSPDQAIKEVMDLVGFQGSPQAQQGQTSTTPASVAPVARPKVIPNIGSGQAAPVKNKVKSIDELKKLANAMS